jgi:hypothetical protein
MVKRLTVEELVEMLEGMPPTAQVTLHIGNPKDSAFTDEIEVRQDGDKVEVYGWVASDNEEAYMPGYGD